MFIKGYDDWKLQGPEESDAIGIEEGQICNRFPELDEDTPKGYKPKRCKGEMIDEDGFFVCSLCGEMI